MGIYCEAALKIAALVPLCLIVFSGCERNNKTAAIRPNPEMRAAIAARPRLAEAAPAATPGMQIRGPRPQSEIDSVYARAGTITAPPVRNGGVALAQPMQVLPPDDGKVTAEPEWDINITREWRHIVIHHSASPTGSAASFDKSHRERGWDGLGYHFVIGNGTGSGDGDIEVGYRWNRQLAGAHAGNAEYNQHGIGICLVGDFQNGTRPTGRQLHKLRQLVRYLQVKTGVPTSEVVGHCNVPGKNTECPGQNMDLHAFRNSLGTGAIGVPIHIAQPRRQTPPPSANTRLARSGAAMP